MGSTRTFLKMSGVAVTTALLVMGGFSGVWARAGQTAQATGTATMAGGASTMTFPPCPPQGIVSGTAGATDTLTTPGTPQVATTEAASVTLPPTMAATVNPNSAYLGVRAEPVDSCGTRIIEVLAQSPAEKAQLQADDVIVAFNGTPEPDIAGLRDAVQNSRPGDTVTLTVQRNVQGNLQQLDIKVTLIAKPPDNTASVTVEAPSGTEAATVAAAATTQAPQ
ncbi:MAG TPA: PDZ domain-containing protein [Aggregatilineales bacterium]|nr:PDZ domain-containing protein [Aggregatilineales bacterium]